MQCSLLLLLLWNNSLFWRERNHVMENICYSLSLATILNHSCDQIDQIPTSHPSLQAPSCFIFIYFYKHLMKTLKKVWWVLYFNISMVYSFSKRYVLNATAYTNMALLPVFLLKMETHLLVREGLYVRGKLCCNWNVTIGILFITIMDSFYGFSFLPSIVLWSDTAM